MKKSEKRLLRKFAEKLGPVNRKQVTLPKSKKKKFCAINVRWNSNYPRTSSKDRKRDGFYTPKVIGAKVPYKEIHEQALGPNEEYDEWNTHRDGLYYDNDITRIRNPHRLFNKEEDILEGNSKQRRLLKIRKARKLKSKVYK